MLLEWSVFALADREAIFDYIEAESPRAAVSVDDRIQACVEKLARFPAVIQPLVRALPLTAAIDALRGNMLQGMSLGQLAAPVAILLAWAAAAFAVSLRIFRWR